jgi:restriction system protein
MNNSQFAAHLAAQHTRQQSTHIAIQAANLSHRNAALLASFHRALQEKGIEFPAVVSQTVVTVTEKVDDGQIIRAMSEPLLAIVERILREPELMYRVDDRKWEEIVAAIYDQSGLFDSVTLTKRSADGGRDVIAEKKGFCSLRVLESVKRYTPGHVVLANDVRALLGVLNADTKASKGVVSTTWKFAPKIWEDQAIMQYVPYRLELIDRDALLNRFEEWSRGSRLR